MVLAQTKRIEIEIQLVGKTLPVGLAPQGKKLGERLAETA